MAPSDPSLSLAELLGEPDRLAFLLLLALVLFTVSLGAWLSRRRRPQPSAEARAAAAEPVPTWPYLVRLELIATLVVVLVISWWAMARALPLGPPADPGVTPPLTKAPWFFVGIQELLQYFDPWLAGSTLPLLGLLGLAALPYLDPESDPQGAGTYRWRPAAVVALLGLAGLWLLPAGVGLFFRGESWSLTPIWRLAAADAPSPAGPGFLSLAERLQLGPLGGQLLGAALCLGPFLGLLLLWPRMRRRGGWAGRVGLGRYLLGGSLLLTLIGVGLKVFGVVVLNIRYVWVTPWFRV